MALDCPVPPFQDRADHSHLQTSLFQRWRQSRIHAGTGRHRQALVISAEAPKPVQVTGDLFSAELCPLPTQEPPRSPATVSIGWGDGPWGWKGERPWGTSTVPLLPCSSKAQLPISGHTGFKLRGAKLHLLLSAPHYYSSLYSSLTSSSRPVQLLPASKSWAHTHTNIRTPLGMASVEHDSLQPWLRGCAHACV